MYVTAVTVDRRDEHGLCRCVVRCVDTVEVTEELIRLDRARWIPDSNWRVPIFHEGDPSDAYPYGAIWVWAKDELDAYIWVEQQLTTVKE